ncbi:MAG TPA: hypothetical protein ACFYED_00185 [Candidatus Tripitaka californicus]|uniref:hypothetical protein n=1 Tax=Candidatus Tripitaka californicus TaxID=3367616 RepID=UPI004029907A
MTTERKRTLPPLYSSPISSTYRQDRIAASAQAVADKKKGKDSELARTMEAAQAITKDASGSAFLRALDTASLPFTAFSEAINGLIGAAVPQKAFQERSARSRAILKAMLTGEVSIADAAGALREVNRERSFAEQLITGFLFDPLNIAIPGAVGIGAGLRAATVGGARLGAEAALGQTARTGVEMLIPFGSGAVKSRLGLESAARLVADKMEEVGVSFTAAGTVGAAKAAWSPGEAEEWGRMSASRVASSSAALKKLQDAADAQGPVAKAAIRLAIDTAGREAEIATIRIEDIDYVSGTVRFWDKAHRHPTVDIAVDQTTLDALKAVQGARTEGFLFPIETAGARTKTKVAESVAELLSRGGYKEPLLSVAAMEKTERSVAQTMRRLAVEIESGNEDLLMRFSLDDIEERLGIDLPRLPRNPDALDNRRAIQVLRDEADRVERAIPGKAQKMEDFDLERREEAIRKASAKPIFQLSQPEKARVMKNPGGWYNRVLQKVGQAAGIEGLAPELITGNVVRKLVASETATVLVRHNYDLTQVGRLLRHSPQELKGLLKHYTHIPPDAVQFADYVQVGRNAAETSWVGIKPSEAWRGRIEDAGEKLRAAGADKKVDVVLVVARKGKKKSLREAMQENQVVTLGRAKIDAMPVSETRRAQIVQSSLSAKETALVEDAYKMISAHGEAQTLGSLRDYFRVMKETSAQGSEEYRVFRRLELGARDEIAQLSFGIDQLFRARMVSIRPGSTSGLDTVYGIWDEMARTGMVGPDELKGLKIQLRDTVAAATANLTPDAMRVLRFQTSLKQLEKLGVPSKLTSKELPNPLPPIETASPEDAKRFADRWLDYNPNAKAGKESETGMRALLANKAFTFSGGKLVGTPSRLLLRFANLGHQGATTQHIFGKDFGALDAAARSERLKALVMGLKRSGNTIDEEVAAAKTRSVVEPVAMDEAVSPPPPPLPTFETTTPADPDWVRTLVGTPTSMEFEATQIRPNKVLAEVADKLRHVPKKPYDSRYAAAHVARQVVEAITLRGASAKGITKLSIEHSDRRVLWDNRQYAVGMKLEGMPGWERMSKLVEDVNNPDPQFFRIPVRVGAEDTDIGKDIVARGRRLARYSKHSDRQIVEDALQHQVYIFDGARGIPERRLAEFYDIDRDMMDAIIHTRRWPKVITDLAVEMVGEKKFAEAIKQAPTPEYFPSVGKNINLQRLEDRRLMLRADTWTHEIDIRDGMEAIERGIEYKHPLKSAAHYATNSIYYAMDVQFSKQLKQLYPGSMAVPKTLQTQARNLQLIYKQLLAGESITTGEKALTIIQKLAALRKSSQAEFLELGTLADEVLTADKAQLQALAPRVEKAVADAEKMRADAEALRDITRGIPGLSGIQFSDTVEAQKAADYWREANKKWMTVMRTTNQVSTGLRFLRAGVDLSVLFIHGIVSALARPQDWAVATKGMFKAIAHPQYLKEYMNQNFEILNEFRNYGGMTSFLEPFEGAKWVTQSAESIPFAGRMFKDVTERAETAFTAWQTIARVEMWKALRAYGKGNPGKLGEVADFVNKMTGVYNPTRAGLPTVQRYLESSFVSFAPMYRRAAYGLLTSIFTGGEVTREIAWRNLAHAATAGAILFGAMPYFTNNNKDALNWDSPKFLSWYDPISKHYIGIGSAYYALIRMVAATTEAITTPEGRESFKPFSVYDNPLLKFWRSQAPVLPSMFIDDVLLGRTYTGEPLRGEDGSVTMAAALRMGREALTPIMVESLIEGGSQGPAGALVALEGFGARSFPESLFDRRRKLQANYLAISDDTDIVNWRAQQEREGKPILYSALPVLLKDRLRLKHPDLQALNDAITADDLRTGRDEQKEAAKFITQLRANQTQVREGLAGVASLFEKGQIDAAKFRGMVSELGRVSIELNKALGRLYPEEVGKLNEERLARIQGEVSVFEGDRLYDLYYASVILNPNNTNADGMFLPENYERADEAFRRSVTASQYEYVQERRRQVKQAPSLIEEFLDAREQLKPYWNLKDRLWRRGSEDWELVDSYMSLPARDQTEYSKRYPRVKVLVRQLGEAREQYRKKNENIDWLLTKWYGNAPRTDYAVRQLGRWQNYQLRAARGGA